MSYNFTDLFLVAALLGFSADDVYSFENAYRHPGGSPTDEMLKVWDFGNHTVTELYNMLCEMNHARGMMLLQDYGKGNYVNCRDQSVSYCVFLVIILLSQPAI